MCKTMLLIDIDIPDCMHMHEVLTVSVQANNIFGVQLFSCLISFLCRQMISLQPGGRNTHCSHMCRL